MFLKAFVNSAVELFQRFRFNLINFLMVAVYLKLSLVVAFEKSYPEQPWLVEIQA